MTSRPPILLEISHSHPAVLYNTPHLITDLTKHNSLQLALPRFFLMHHTRTGARHVLSGSPNSISSSMHPFRHFIPGLLTTTILANTPRYITHLSNAPIALAAFGTEKTFHANVIPNIRLQGSGTARMRLASIQEGEARFSRGKTTLTDTLESCTAKQTSCYISSIPSLSLFINRS